LTNNRIDSGIYFVDLRALDLDAFVHYNNGWNFISMLAVICFTQKIHNLSIKCNPQFSEFVLILNVVMVVLFQSFSTTEWFAVFYKRCTRSLAITRCRQSTNGVSFIGGFCKSVFEFVCIVVAS
jgi:hypothetical protein